MSLRKAVHRSLRSLALVLAPASVVLAWSRPLAAGGVADWVNQRLAEQAKSFEDGDALALEARTLTKERKSERFLAGVRGGSARASGDGAEPRLALGLELALERRLVLETDGVPALFGEQHRVALALWLGAPTEARVEAAIGPALVWSEHGAVFLRAGGAAAFGWESNDAAALFDLASADLGLLLDGDALFEVSARARGRVALREADSGAALLAGAGARLFVRPLALDAEWLAPLARSRESEAPTFAVALCSFLGGPALCGVASRGASLARGGEPVVRLELRLGWGALARESG